MQRIGNHRRVDDVFHRHDVAQHRVRVVLRVVRCRDLHPGELLAGGAKLMHVTHGAHAVCVMRCRAISGLEIHFRAKSTWRHQASSGFSGQRNQRDGTLPRSDRLGSMTERDDIGAAARLGRIDVAHLEAEIIDHRHDAAGRVSGAEIAVNIGLRQACILQCALGTFGMQLRGGLVGRVPGGMLVDPGNIGFSLDTQKTSPLLWSADFLACHAANGKRHEFRGANTTGASCSIPRRSAARSTGAD